MRYAETLLRWSAVLPLLVVAACGFQLRGPVDLPPELLPLYVDTSAVGHELAKELDILFRANRVTLASNRSEAAAVLEIQHASKSRRVLSVDSSGRVQEYELTLEVHYQLHSDLLKQNGIETGVNKIELTRDLLFDPTSVLAVGYETDTLYRDMASDSARIILQQLQALAATVKQDHRL